MTAHPIDLVYVDGSNVSKSSVRGMVKLREALRVADAAEIRNTNFSGHFGGLYVAALGFYFDLDTSDTTSPDDGVNTIIDFNNNRFKKRPISTTISERTVVASGAVTVGASDDVILINKTVPEATTVNLPAAATRVAGGSKRIKIVDGANNASNASYNITIVPSGVETIASLPQWLISTDGGSIELHPRPDGTGWYI